MNDKGGMNRRSFFSLGAHNVAKLKFDSFERDIRQQSKSFIRPPFAVSSVDFVLNCSRCGDCIASCPHDVIFAIPDTKGPAMSNTPAMDLINRGCHLCVDWPCVSACATGALAFPILATDDQMSNSDHNHLDLIESGSEAMPVMPPTEVSDNEIRHEAETTIEESPPQRLFPTPQECPPMAKVRINTSVCLPYSGPECGACKGSCPIPDTLVWHDEKPSINVASCVGCGLCREVCITQPNAIDIYSL